MVPAGARAIGESLKGAIRSTQLINIARRTLGQVGQRAPRHVVPLYALPKT
jgi:hypothetical protein